LPETAECPKVGNKALRSKYASGVKRDDCVSRIFKGLGLPHLICANYQCAKILYNVTSTICLRRKKYTSALT